VLRLYVTGQTPRAQRAVSNLSRICDEHLGDDYDVQIIDVLERPELAEKEKIIATPTLVKVTPPPARRIIGDLSDSAKVLMGLDLQPAVSRGHREDA
jgi:circadian clock protein KaiB